MTDGPTITDVILIQAPRAAVFRALTDPEELGQWMATTAESDPRSGGRFRYAFEFEDAAQNNEQAGEYLDVETDRRIVLPWRFPFSPKATTVEYVLDDEADATRVSFTHSGFETGEPWDSARARFGPGWRAFLESLKQWVEKRTASRPLGIKGASTATPTG
jgi:uncharacterized protein YndB with AHSA1/START domain